MINMILLIVARQLLQLNQIVTAIGRDSSEIGVKLKEVPVAIRDEI